MLIVAALGGNALLRRGETPDQASQQRNVAIAVRALASLAREHRLVITHGNGPQVGLLAIEQETAEAPRYGLDVLGSETQGMIGFLVEEALREVLPGREVATLLTQVIVDPGDPAFAHPTKPIGPAYSRDRADAIAEQRGWRMAPDGAAYRRVVPSPEPRRIVELNAIRLLVAAGVTVICAGGGGVPVAEDRAGGWHGVEAVVDKDLTSALLAIALGADRLLLLTDVDAVYEGWRTARARPLRTISAMALRAMTFAAGSMAPKVEAACRFVEATGHPASIGALDAAGALLDGASGTTVVPGPASPIVYGDAGRA